jgi:hypothetical protein
VLVWWTLRCDANHEWSVLHDDTTRPPDGYEICPHDGTPAVTLKQMPPADRVRITLAPAARVADPETGVVEAEHRYFIELGRWNASEVLRSESFFDWPEAIERASWFANASWEEARNRWERTGLGRA